MRQLLFTLPLALSVSGGPVQAGHHENDEGGFYKLANLAGSCWEGAEETSGDQELRCYEWVFGDKFIREKLTVSVGDQVYEGETLYTAAKGETNMTFTYFSSDGGTGEGEAFSTETGLAFPEERYDDGQGNVMVLKQTLDILSEDSFEFVMRTQTENGWQVIRRTVLTRAK